MGCAYSGYLILPLCRQQSPTRAAGGPGDPALPGCIQPALASPQLSTGKDLKAAAGRLQPDHLPHLPAAAPWAARALAGTELTKSNPKWPVLPSKLAATQGSSCTQEMEGPERKHVCSASAS